MNEPDPIGEQIEDVVERMVSDASPFEDTTSDGGSDEADRDGHQAIGDENFTA